EGQQQRGDRDPQVAVGDGAAAGGPELRVLGVPVVDHRALARRRAARTFRYHGHDLSPEDAADAWPEAACLPMSGVLRTSLKYIQIRETQTTPYSSMKQEERTPVRSTSAPNMIG